MAARHTGLYYLGNRARQVQSAEMERRWGEIKKEKVRNSSLLRCPISLRAATPVADGWLHNMKIFISPDRIYPVAKQTENNKLSNLTIDINSQHIQHDEVGNT